jgi:peptide/nickel transport system substrate-binding protein
MRLVTLGAGLALLDACTSVTSPSSSAPTASATQPVAGPRSDAGIANATIVSTPGPASATTTSAQPRRGGTLRHAQTADVASLDPHLTTTAGSETTYLVFDRLTAYDLNMKPQPMLAESWDISSNFKSFKLNLRKGVQYHSGRELTADDVKYSLLRPRDSAVGAGLLGGISNWFSTIEATDKYTVTLTTDAPQPGFFDGLENFNIVDKVSLEGPEGKSKLVGTGPFQMVEWANGDHFAVARNSNYWQSGKPYLDGVTINIRNQQTMAVQLESGGLDSAKNLALTDFVRLKNDSGFQALPHPSPGAFFEIGMNTNHPPLGDKRVRQAMNFAIDRARFAQTSLNGISTPLELPWSPSSPAYDASKNATYPYDLERARALLKDAGVAGFETDLLVIGVAMPQLVDFGQIFQASLAQLGVTLNIKNLEQSVWLDLVINKKPDYTGFWGSNDGPGNLSPGYLFSGSPGWRTVNNHSAFQSDEWTSLVSDVLAETDAERRKQLYNQVNDYVLDQSFTVPIATNPITITLSDKVHGIDYWLHGGAVSFTGVWLDA